MDVAIILRQAKVLPEQLLHWLLEGRRIYPPKSWPQSQSRRISRPLQALTGISQAAIAFYS
jgi:hypothetical protein